MKIVHICMNAPYIDGWGYQENLLPAYLSKKGVESVVIASNIMPPYLNKENVNVGESYFEGVKIVRLACKTLGPMIFAHGLKRTLSQEKPDAVFHHNLNATTLITCEKYCNEQSIPLMVDNHADFINCNQNKIYQFLYYKTFVGKLVNYYSHSIKKYYGVTRSRCRFLKEIFCIDSNKIDFLPIGLDIDKSEAIDNLLILRKKHHFDSSKFIIVSGGKMGIGKGTQELILAVEALLQSLANVELLLFGKFEDKDTEDLAKSKSFVKIEGWCDRAKTLELLKLADVAVWPIHHTTLCEDAIACGTPLLLRKTETTEHLINGNGAFMAEGNKEELYDCLNIFINQTYEEKQQMEDRCLCMKSILSYHTVANKVINDINL